VLAVMATLGTRWAITPTLKLYQWLDEGEADIERARRDIPRWRVKDAMTLDLISVTPGTPVIEIARLLSRRQACVLITETTGRLAGIITESDLFLKQERLRYTEQPYLALFKLPISPEQLPLKYAELGAALAAEDVMTRKVIWVKESNSLEHAIQLLMRYDLKRLPVLDTGPEAGGKLIGLITRADIIRLFTTNQPTDRSHAADDQTSNLA